MNKELQEFANDVTAKWDSLPKDQILTDILETLEKTRCSYKSEIKNIENGFGIYAFYIKPKERFSKVENLINVWNENGFEKYPKVVKKRFRVQECCSKGWYSFYIGKGEKLRSRVEEHLFHHSTHATYGLKLKERKQFLVNNELEVGYWHLPEMSGVPREIKQFIITNFESRLRNELKPWIGKQ